MKARHLKKILPASVIQFCSLIAYANETLSIPHPQGTLFEPSNSNIFCTGYGPPLEIDDATRIAPVMVRWGGNTSSRFNFKLGNVWNAGADWNFANVTRGPRNLWEKWIQDHANANERVIFTVPILGWLAKDTSSRGDPKNPNPATTGEPLTDSDFRMLVGRIKELLPHQDRIYPLDNEPFQWHHIHGDAVAQKVTPEKFAKQWLHYARLVREVDEQAFLTGPGLWGYADVQNLPAFLKAVLGQRDKNGKPLLNIVSAGLYPQNQKLLATLADITGRTALNNDAVVATDTLRVATTANFDDETFVDPSWINAPIAHIPKLRKIIHETAIAKKLKRESIPQIGIAEYNWGAPYSASGAAAQAIILLKGLRLHLHHMCSFTWPPTDSAAGRIFAALRENIIGSDAGKPTLAILRNQKSTEPWVWFQDTEGRLALFFVAAKNVNFMLPKSILEKNKSARIELFDYQMNRWEVVKPDKDETFPAKAFGVYRWGAFPERSTTVLPPANAPKPQ
jgi:hypothetical protein